MSISSVGNSDAYARYRQQALDLLASPGQQMQAGQTAALSYITPPATTDPSDTNPFATKFKTDLSMLNGSNDGKSHAHGAHGHHGKADATSQTSDSTATTDTAATDPLQQTLTEFANLLKTAAGIAAVIA
ncbi:hypothetical protein RLW55_20185 [Hyphomicrobium sp. B1]|uniref:hypothetical protein n=1 Tax=unclassified Hyphomicrobium TaxID=2619925 RepID=UPI00391BE9FD